MVEANVDIVIDCHNIEVLPAFWAAALGYRKIGSKDQYGPLMPNDPAHPPLILQRVPEQKTAKTRVHIRHGQPGVALYDAPGQLSGRLRTPWMPDYGAYWDAITDMTTTS